MAQTFFAHSQWKVVFPGQKLKLITAEQVVHSCLTGLSTLQVSACSTGVPRSIHRA